MRIGTFIKASLTVASLALGMALTSSSANAQNLLVNPGFETDNASVNDVSGATGWGGFNFRFTTDDQKRTGNNSLKLFGDFSVGGASGASQDKPATAGVGYTASAWALNAAADPLQGNNFGLLQLFFLNGSNAVIGSAIESAHFGANSPLGTWTLLTASGTAPAGTAAARIQLLHVQANDPVTGGSVFFDDTSLSAVPEPTSLALVGLTGLGLMSRRRRA